MSENNASTDLLVKAREDLAANMKQRGLGAVIWDLATAGFPYLPEIELPSEKEDEEPKTVGVTGIYNYNGTIYIIEEGIADISVDDFYNADNEVKPTIVTLTEDKADKYFGDPQGKKGFNAGGDLEEWLAIADCYFQALAEEFEP